MIIFCVCDHRKDLALAHPSPPDAVVTALYSKVVILLLLAIVITLIPPIYLKFLHCVLWCLV